MAAHGNVHSGVARTSQQSEYFVGTCSVAGDIQTVDCNNPVARHDTGFFGSTASDYLHDVKGIVDHLELDAYSEERAFQIAVGGSTLGGRYIYRVRIEVQKNFRNCKFDKAVVAHRIHVVFSNEFKHLVKFGAGGSVASVCCQKTAGPKAEQHKRGSRYRQPEHIFSTFVGFHRCVVSSAAICTHSIPARRISSIPSAIL